MNLLPESARASVAAAYRNNILLVGALTLLFIACMALLALAPATLVSSEKNAAAELTVFEPRSAQSVQDRENALETQSLLALFAPLATSTTPVTRAIEETLLLRPPGVSVEAVSFTKGAKGTLVISGISNGRDALNAYKIALLNRGIFNRVSVPVNALVGASSGGVFSITLTGEF